MRQLWLILAIFGVAILAAWHGVGYGPTYGVLYGTLALQALLISATFTILSVQRHDLKLAAGMALGWFGCAGIMGWWWLYAQLGRPDWMVDNPILLMFCGVYLAGAWWHFRSLGESSKRHGLWLAFFFIAFIVALLAEAVW